MKYLKYQEISNKNWDDYISLLKGSTFNFSSDKINFDLEYAEHIIANESALCLVDNKPIGAVAIYVEKLAEQEPTITWSGTYCLAPIIHQELSYRLQEKYMEKMLDYVEEIGTSYGCSKIMLRYDPLANPENKEKLYNYNYLLRRGFLDRSSLTQLLDLRKEEKELLSEVRKGHKSDIKKGYYEITFFDKESVTREIIEEYRRIYESDAGKITRNSQMSHHYFNFVKNGKGIIGLAKKENKNIAVIVVTFYENTAYYNSYAELSDQLDGISVGHILQWKTILELKRRKISFYEVGEQVFGETHYDDPEQKLINISRFKRGFGGYTVPFFRGVKIIH